MRRAGGWVLGAVAVSAMAAGGLVAFRPILKRETIFFGLWAGVPGPTQDALESGIMFALKEAGGRAGRFRVQRATGSLPPGTEVSVSIRIDDPALPMAQTWSHDSTGAVKKYAEFRLFADQEALGRAAARWANDSGAERVVLLHEPEVRETADVKIGFREAAKKIVLTIETEFDWREAPQPAMDRVIAAKPDLVFYAGELAPYSRAYQIFSELRKKGYAGRLMVADAEPLISFLAVQTPLVEGTLLASAIPPPSPKFAAAYEPATGRRAGPHAWPGYLVMNAVLDLIDRADSGRPADLGAAVMAQPPASVPAALYAAKEGRFVFLQDLK
jgi:hypothetical protein